ncbi:hypothetical protein 3 [Wuhan spider virus 8]|uniref:hypothetical protein 3 n=1 Tax=Wuhan spider virus 8 TaxID=1923757 RepID=UPI00090A9729|nr:hypothetical protein 3 [Wuhan spider virus 8]APG76395.1 hypothetical protein 3 [Wuhan spider virus 8]
MFVKMAKTIGRQPKASWKQMVASRMSKRRRRYALGAQYYWEQGVTRQDAHLSAFLKLEFYKEEKLVEKECRTIQHRRVAYNYALLRWLCNIEHSMYSKLRNVDDSPRILKSVPPPMRAFMVWRAWESLGPTVRCYCLDHSRFDAHVVRDWLEMEHDFYKMCSESRRELAWLLRMQLRAHGRTAGGATYVQDGKRSSGDVNTASGNSADNDAMLLAHMPDNVCEIVAEVCVAAGFPDLASRASDYRFAVALLLQLLEVELTPKVGEEPPDPVEGTPLRVITYCDGDDGLVLSNFKLDFFFALFGFSTEITVATSLEQIEFCQSKLIMTSGGPAFARDPAKVRNMVMHCRNLPYHQREGVLKASAFTEYIAQQGVWHNQMLAYKCYKACGSASPIFLNKDLAWRCAALEPVEITEPKWDPIAIASFERAWQFTLEEALFFDPVLRTATEGVVKKSSTLDDGTEQKECFLPDHGWPDLVDPTVCWRCWAEQKPEAAAAEETTRCCRHSCDSNCGGWGGDG